MNYELTYAGSWDAASFFRNLTESNRLCQKEGFVFTEVSGLKGMSELLAAAQTAPNIISIDETSDGFAQIVSTPSRTMVKTGYMSMKCAPLDMQARRECFDIMKEIFRQFMTVLIRERTRLANRQVALNPRITFNEIDYYFAPGSACAWFAIEITIPVDMRYRPDEWTGPITN